MTLDVSFIWTAFKLLLSAVPTTLAITVVSVVCSVAIGVSVTAVRMYRIPVASQLAAAYVTVIRGTPMLTHLLIIYYGLTMLLDQSAERFGWSFNSSAMPMIGFAFISFSITAGAYMAEIVRAGISAVHQGQLEAAYSVGMTALQAMRRVILPQAFTASLPNLTNLVIGMLHGSTLVFTVSVVDINAKAQVVASTNWKFFEAYLAAALIFWGLTVILERAAGRLERKLGVYARGGVRG